MKTFLISRIVGSDIRSRSCISLLREALHPEKYEVVLDFEGVRFMSRSFTDELYTFLHKHPQVKMTRMSEDVQTMYDAVQRSRTETRVLPDVADDKILKISDMESLQYYFAAF